MNPCLWYNGNWGHIMSCIINARALGELTIARVFASEVAHNVSDSFLFLLPWKCYFANNLNCLRLWASRLAPTIYCYISIICLNGTVCGICGCSNTKSQSRDDRRQCLCFHRAKYHPTVDQDEHRVGVNLSNDTHRDLVIHWITRKDW